MSLRLAAPSDVHEIATIYNESVLNNTATFDTEVKGDDYMLDWLGQHNHKYCVMVYEWDGRVVAWASLSRYSDRCAYDNTAEFSIYIHPDFRGRGFSNVLMKAVLEQGKNQGIHAVISRITQGNDISIKLHESFGFFTVGVLKEVGVKFGQLLDVTIMQRLM